MIGQYLSNTNEIGTIHILQNILQVNKASIIKQLCLNDSSHDLQTNCAISFYFYLYLMFYVCAARFDVTENLEKFFVYEVN